MSASQCLSRNFGTPFDRFRANGTPTAKQVDACPEMLLVPEFTQGNGLRTLMPVPELSRN